MFESQQCIGVVSRGKITGFDQHGVLLVEPEDGGPVVPCYCIRNGAEPPPEYLMRAVW